MNFKIIGIGEALWDLLPSGPQLGGAPANFACHAHSLGAEAGVITRVGDDALGHEVLSRFVQMGLSVAAVQKDNLAPTGTVIVELLEDKTARYTFPDNVAWDRLEATASALDAVRTADAVCFGTLAQRGETSRNSVQKLLASTPPNALRIFDINLRQHYFSKEIIESSLKLANILKLNDAEFPIIAQMFDLTGSIRDQVKKVAEQFELQMVALTRGAEGSLLYQSGQWSDRPSAPVDVVDTVGAGDAFTATLALGLLHKMELDSINVLAGEVAQYVCSHAGATPPLPKTFQEHLKH